MTVKKALFKIFYFSIIIFFSDCISKKNGCLTIESSFGDKHYKTKGCFNNDLEDGQWFIYDTNDKLLESGSFENGRRIGKWNYPQNLSDTIIDWKKYKNENLDLEFSVPKLLQVLEDSSEYTKFTNGDSSKLFNLVVSLHSFDSHNITFDSYFKQAEDKIRSMGWSVTTAKQKITSRNTTIFHNEYSITTAEQMKFKIKSVYLLVGKDRLFEMNCRYQENIEATARIIFFSVLSNCFYKNERLINPF